MKTIWTIAFKEFRDRLRSGWVIASIFIWLAAILLTSFFGLIQIGRIGVQGYERTTMSLLNLAQYLAPLLGLLIGHDAIVREREDRTLHLIIASGSSRSALTLGKFFGSALTVVVPLFSGFAMAGALVGVAARDASMAPFLKLSISTIAVGVVFAGIGTIVSIFARSRIQALVSALLIWGVVVFAFDLVALGIIVSNKAPQASKEIELICDATHVNGQADIHSGFDRVSADAAVHPLQKHSPFWIWFNPVDIFRLINLPPTMNLSVPMASAIASGACWIALSLIAGTWRLKRIDL